jgi:hypothetical protein
MSAHEVTPDFVAELKAAGFTDLTPEQLVALRAHDVDAAFIEELREMGLLAKEKGEQ